MYSRKVDEDEPTFSAHSCSLAAKKKISRKPKGWHNLNPMVGWTFVSWFLRVVPKEPHPSTLLHS